MRKSKKKQVMLFIRLILKRLMESYLWSWIIFMLHMFLCSKMRVRPNNFNLFMISYKKIIYILIFFLLFIEILGDLIDKEVYEDHWKPLHITCDGPKIFHLFFVVDVLLFVKVKTYQVHFIANIGIISISFKSQRKTR